MFGGVTPVVMVGQTYTGASVVELVVVVVLVEVVVVVEVGVGVGAGQEGTLRVSVSVVTVPANDKARPVQVTVLPIVIPASSMLVPTKVEFAPRVVAAVGAQKTSQDEAPLSVTTELASVVRAPSILKIYVPLPERVIPPAPMEAALAAPVQ